MLQRVVRLGVLTSALVIPIMAHGAAGHTQGSWSVSQNGSAQYVIPLWTPPGIRGVQPALALTYSSSSGNGYFGVGWNLSGLSRIARCSKTWAQDGTAREVRNDTADRFCLDGNQLRLVSGTYGAAGAEYRTEIETFARINSWGTAGNGPAYFVVEQKNGLVYEYGNTADSRIESVGQSTARVWVLNQIRDRSGNAMLFNYTEDATNGSYRIANIQYTQNTTAGISPHYQVTFTYESVPVGEVDSTYQANAPIKRVTRVDRIDVTHDAAQVRRYELTYEAALSSTSKSRLASVQECAGAALDCYPATTFSYQNGTVGFDAEVNTGFSLPSSVRPWSLDVNGDGRQDLVYPSSATSGSGTWMVAFANASGSYNTPVNTGITNTNWSGAVPIDYNADGLADLLVPYSGGTWWVMLGTTSGLASPSDTSIPTTTTGTGANARAIDIDGDGLEDLVWADLIGYAGGDAIRYRLRVWGGTFSSTVTTLVGPLPADEMMSNVFGAVGQSLPQRVPDFNGDGRGDVFYEKTTRTWLDTSYFYSYSLQVVISGGGTFAAGGLSASSPAYFGDFNGDGMSDLIYYTSAANFRIRFSTGTSFTGEVVGPSIAGYSAQWSILDWDGDGYDDLLLNYYNTGTWYVIRSTGEALASASSTGLPSATDVTVTDVNGDGVLEIAYGVSGVLKHRTHAGVAPDLLLTATDGFGMGVTFSYAPISQNVYTKYADASFPDQDYQGPLYVVSGVTASTGIASPTTYTQSYWYYGARRHLQGRGFEGFYAQRMYDSRTGLYVYDYFRRDFPFTGMVFQSDLYQSNGSTLIRRLQNTPSDSSTGSGFETRHYPYMSASTADTYELGGSRDGAWVARQTTSTTIDSYGNPTVVTRTAQDKDSLSPWSAETYTTVTTNTVTNDTANWCLGISSQTTLQSTLPDTSSQTRTQSATIDYAMCRITQSVIEPASSTLVVTTTLGFDTCGNVNSEQVVGKNPDGTNMAARTTTANFGSRCQFPETVTNALSQSSTIAYRYDLGVRSSVTDPNGLAISWLYDDFGRATRETHPDGTYTAWSRASYVSSDLRLQTTQTRYASNDVAIRTAYFYHDGFDRLRYDEQQNLSGGLTYRVSTYDALGRPSIEYMPYSSSSNGYRQRSYDAIGRMTADALYNAGGALDRQTTYAYTGRYIAVTNPRGDTTQRYIDVRGKLRRVVDPSPGGTTNYAYDHFGNSLSITDPASNVTSFGHNLRGFMTSTSDPDRGTWTYTPNSLGEVVSQTDAKSQTLTMTYDALSRPLTRVETEGTSTWTWGTSAAAKNIGQLQSLSGPGYSETYVYDSLGRLATTTYSADTTYQVDYAYNFTTGLLDIVTYPTSTGSYPLRAGYVYQYGILSRVIDYNSLAFPTTTVWWQLNATDDWGNPIDEQLGNGVHILANNDGLTGHLNWRTSGTNAAYNNQQNLSFLWDKNENLTDRVDVNQGNLTEHFVYDALNRLDYSTRNGATNLDVTLDAIGNITYRSDVGTYTYDATRKHAVTSTSNGWSFTYDANGNMLTGRGATLTWTSYDLPASITNGSISSQFSYTPTRAYWRQVAQYSGGPETTIYIGGLFEKVTGASGTDYRHMIRAGSATIIVTRSTGSNNNTYYVSQDHLGSSTAVTDSAGTLTVSESFAAYGARRGSAWQGSPTSGDWTAIANSTRRGFTGHTMVDNLSLIHMNGRLYDPMIGRFVSADPFIDGIGSQGLNRYSYLGNSPLSRVDPSGFVGRDLGRILKEDAQEAAQNWVNAHYSGITTIEAFQGFQGNRASGSRIPDFGAGLRSGAAASGGSYGGHIIGYVPATRSGVVAIDDNGNEIGEANWSESRARLVDLGPALTQFMLARVNVLVSQVGSIAGGVNRGASYLQSGLSFVSAGASIVLSSGSLDSQKASIAVTTMVGAESLASKASVVGNVAAGIQATAQLAQGNLQDAATTVAQLAVQSTFTEAGAAVGSFFGPGPGTAVGAGVGNLIGGSPVVSVPVERGVNAVAGGIEAQATTLFWDIQRTLMIGCRGGC